MSDALATALRELLAPIVKDAVELALAEYVPAAGPAEVMTEAQACELLQVSRPTLLKMGPPHVLAGDHRRYIRADVLEWMRLRGAGLCTVCKTPHENTSPGECRLAAGSASR